MTYIIANLVRSVKNLLSNLIEKPRVVVALRCGFAPVIRWHQNLFFFFFPAAFGTLSVGSILIKNLYVVASWATAMPIAHFTRFKADVTEDLLWSQ